MARRPRVFAPGLLYHVIVRGNQRQATFLREGDYAAYLERLATYRQKHGVTVWAYRIIKQSAKRTGWVLWGLLLVSSAVGTLAAWAQYPFRAQITKDGTAVLL